jgi:nitroreductase
MDFSELAAKRQSVRKFSPSPVDRDKLDKCLEAARLAPSACNAQPWSFVVVDDPVRREQVENATFDAAASFNRFALGAPVAVAVVMERANFTSKLGQVLKGRDYRPIDIGLAAGNFCLQAADLGLGTCILGWYNERKIKEIIGVPRSKEITLVILVGYPEDPAVRPKVRKERGEMASYNSYGGAAD